MSQTPEKKSVAIVGAGINGLVAANYLQRAGYEVIMLERKAYVGGACISQPLSYQGKEIRYPQGASVLGMMQDFVFKETGLSEKVEIYAPNHDEIVWFKDEESPTKIEHNEVFNADLQKVVSFLRDGYKSGNPPTLEDANNALGERIVSLWITGTARKLIDTYFTSEKTKVFYAISVNESGPVSIDSVYSAFSIPLMSSGSVFNGVWGFVKGGIWKLTEALAQINEDLGVLRRP
jgi:phytoene dehydrogenase-like protein